MSRPQILVTRPDHNPEIAIAHTPTKADNEPHSNLAHLAPMVEKLEGKATSWKSQAEQCTLSHHMRPTTIGRAHPLVACNSSVGALVRALTLKRALAGLSQSACKDAMLPPCLLTPGRAALGRCDKEGYALRPHCTGGEAHGLGACRHGPGRAEVLPRCSLNTP